MKKEPLLVIPHTFSNEFRIRGIELARGLASHFDVYCLRWPDAIQVHGEAGLRRRLRRLGCALSSLRPSVQVSADGDLHFLRVPVVQPVLLQRLVGARAALRIAARLNSWLLHRAIRRIGVPIRKVLLSAMHYDVARLLPMEVWLDIWDIHVVDEDRFSSQEIKNYCDAIARMASMACGVSIPNSYLQQWLKERTGLHAEVVPTGTWLDYNRHPDPGRVETIRARYALGGKYVVGYIGNHTDSSGIDFLMQVAEYATSRATDITFLIVGPLDDLWKPLVAKFPGNTQVIFTGPVSAQDVVNHLHCIDLGVYCSPPRFRHRAYTLPLKVVEYSSARKFVLSTPLEQMGRLGWPHVLIPDYTPEGWYAAIQDVRRRTWNPDWDLLIEPYDWHSIATRLAGCLRMTEERRGAPVKHAENL